MGNNSSVKHAKLAHRTGIFTAAYILFFSIYASVTNNYEFIFYSLILFVLLLLTIHIYNRVRFNNWIIVALSLFGLLHLAGGNLTWDGIRLYDLEYFWGVLHFDNLVHALGTFLATLIVYNLIAPFIDLRVRERYSVFYLLLILMALGVGSINELIEFSAVVFLGAGESVGDYFNNATDLLFNASGSLIAIVVIHQYLGGKRKVTL